MTAITTELQIEAIADLIERKRVARRIAFGSGALTLVIAAVAVLLSIVAA